MPATASPLRIGYIRTVLFAFTAALSVPQAHAASELGGKTDTVTVEVAFTPDQTIDDLMRIKNEMRTLGITLSYQELRFNEEGKLSYMRFEVADGRGNSGSATSMDLTKHAPWGFRIDRSENSDRPFGVGQLAQLASPR